MKSGGVFFFFCFVLFCFILSMGSNNRRGNKSSFSTHNNNEAKVQSQKQLLIFNSFQWKFNTEPKLTEGV